MLLDIVDGHCEEAFHSLQDKTGIVLADLLEGRPSLLIMLEAVNRPKLARLTVETLSAVEQVTENVSLLPVCKQSGKAGNKKSFN